MVVDADAATPTRHTVGVFFRIIGMLHLFMVISFLLKSTTQWLACKKSAPSNSSCARSLHTYATCCFTAFPIPISTFVTPRIGWCVRCNVSLSVRILSNKSLDSYWGASVNKRVYGVLVDVAFHENSVSRLHASHKFRSRWWWRERGYLRGNPTLLEFPELPLRLLIRGQLRW